MDYKEQIDRLRSEILELENSELAVELFDGLIADLLARAAAEEARAEKAERERDDFKAKYIEAVKRACELSKIVDDHGWEE